MQMPKVNMCEATECFYNQDSNCHAIAITVGSPCPKCDTYIDKSAHGSPADIGKVGACHVDECTFNEQLSCQAPAINVDHHKEHADCITFTPK